MLADIMSRFRPALIMALTGLACGLTPQLALYFSLSFFTRLSALLFAAYAALFLSLALALAGAALAGRLAGHLGKARRPFPGLRALLLLDAAALAALWHRLLNPFPAGPLIQNQQYLPAALVIFAPFLALALFVLLMKKLL